MDGSLGTLGVVVAFVAALLGLCCQLARLRLEATGRHAAPWLAGGWLVPLVVLGTLLAVGAMQFALITHDFSLAYVAANNAPVTPLFYSITGMWSALEGSILLWALLLALVTAVFVACHLRDRHDPVVGWATAVLLAVDAFFLGLIAGPASPFVRAAAGSPRQGAGPNALLQDNPLVAIHPPLIYTGLVLFSVPFAIVVGRLASGRLGPEWRAATRRWALAAWTALTVGLLLGAWWSYQVLGWGGFWGWDPVENAALVPWLVGTALVHSIVVEERRGLLRVWNATLAIAAFALTILATYFTRSGVLVSVHAFSASTLGDVLLAGFAVVVAVGLGLLAWRGDRLRAPLGIDEPMSREGAFVANNVLFVGFAAVVLLGTVFPLAYQAIQHQAVTVGPPYFDAVAVPAGLCVLFLMAVAPVLGWRHVDVAVLWQRLRAPLWAGTALVVVLVALGVRGVGTLVAYLLAVVAASTALRTLGRNLRAARSRGAWAIGLLGSSSGGMVVHLGVVLAVVGIVSSTSFATRAEVAFAPGQTRTVGGHTFQYVGLRRVTDAVRTAYQVVVRVDGGALFYPGVTQFVGRADQRVDTPAIDSSLLSDEYLTYDAIGVGTAFSGPALDRTLPRGWVVLGVTVEPMVAWLWLGGLVAGVGGVLALAPVAFTRRRRGRADAAGATDDPGVAEEPVPERALEAV